VSVLGPCRGRGATASPWSRGSAKPRHSSTRAFVDEIFKGARPGDLPIEQPTRIDPVINRKTAALPRVAIPPLLLPRAQRAIE
jgi:ABC-type uncharacterized transport system substrate-binding protein